jgi:hypothetical protein
MPSEKVSAVCIEWQRLGGVLVPKVTPCALFSLSFVRLMMFLMTSFWFRLCSLLLHHIGRLYSHFRPRCLHARQEDFPSSHFFRRRRHVKHPAQLPVSKCQSAGTLHKGFGAKAYHFVNDGASWQQQLASLIEGLLFPPWLRTVSQRMRDELRRTWAPQVLSTQRCGR